MLQLDFPLVSVFQPGGGRGAVCQESVCSTAVPHESENARQHAFPKLCVVRTGRGELPIPGRVGVRRERGRPFPLTSNVSVCWTDPKYTYLVECTLNTLSINFSLTFRSHATEPQKLDGCPHIILFILR